LRVIKKKKKKTVFYTRKISGTPRLHLTSRKYLLVFFFCITLKPTVE